MAINLDKRAYAHATTDHLDSRELARRITLNPHNIGNMAGVPHMNAHEVAAARFEAEGRAAYPLGRNPYQAGTMACTRWARGWHQVDDYHTNDGTPVEQDGEDFYLVDDYHTNDGTPVEQDGEDFYLAEGVHVSAPFPVRFLSISEAMRARDWFVFVWCPANGVTPRFGER